jgi:hypothetical protein
MDPITVAAAGALAALHPYLPALAKAAAKKLGEELPGASEIPS